MIRRECPEQEPTVGDRPSDDPNDALILDLVPVVRRVIAARVQDTTAVEDLVQEVLARLFEVRDRVAPEALGAYAITTASNLVASHGRGDDLRRRHLHRLLDLRAPPTPEEEVLADEERRAVEAALAELPAPEREALLAHDVSGVDLASLAPAFGATRGALASRLRRARARLRVEYVLAIRRLIPPTERCRPVLLALSLGERRRQSELDVDGHLEDCRFCSALAEELAARRRPLGVFWPFAAVAELLRRSGRAVGRKPVHTAVGVATTVGVVALVAGTIGRSPAPPPPAGCVQGAAIADGGMAAAGKQISVSSGAELRQYVGQDVVVCAVSVQSVAANEGFWLGTSEQERVWVQIITTGESRLRVEVGDALSFTGRVVAHDQDYPQRVGVGPSQGAAALAQDGSHIEVLEGEIELRKAPP